MQLTWHGPNIFNHSTGFFRGRCDTQCQNGPMTKTSLQARSSEIPALTDDTIPSVNPKGIPALNYLFCRCPSLTRNTKLQASTCPSLPQLASAKKRQKRSVNQFSVCLRKWIANCFRCGPFIASLENVVTKLCAILVCSNPLIHVVPKKNANASPLPPAV